MAYYRSKLSKIQEAKLDICVSIFCIFVCIGAFIFGIICAISIINSEKGSPILRIIGGIGFFSFFGGGGIGGIIACIDGLKDNIMRVKNG